MSRGATAECRGPTREEQEAAKAAGTQKTEAQINAETQKLATEVRPPQPSVLPGDTWTSEGHWWGSARTLYFNIAC